MTAVDENTIYICVYVMLQISQQAMLDSLEKECKETEYNGEQKKLAHLTYHALLFWDN